MPKYLPFTDERKLEIIQRLYHKLKGKELGPETAIWPALTYIRIRRSLLDEITMLTWTEAERLSQESPTRKPITSEVPLSTKSKKRA